MPQYVHFNQNENFKEGVITLRGRKGEEYPTPALFVSNYGWIPCTRKLRKNFTTNSRELALVITTKEDKHPPYTSNIWITRFAEIEFTFSLT